MLPALQLRHAKRDDVGIEERAAALERKRLPSQLSQVQLVPRCFQFGGVLRGEEALESRRKSAQPPNRIHTRNVESAWILRYPIRRLNLARSCAGAGPSSPPFSR